MPGVAVASAVLLCAAAFSPPPQPPLPACSFAIVASPETLRDDGWRAAVDALAAKHSAEARVCLVQSAATAARPSLAAAAPDYVAFVLRPDEFDYATLVALKHMMRDLDPDPYEDAIWGIVTGPDAATALRIASSPEPRQLASVLATTGVEPDIVTGRVCVVSDAFPAGVWWRKGDDGRVERNCVTGDTSAVFARAWREDDPQCIVTSAHATERNLEMPFSFGNLICEDGRFFAVPRVQGPFAQHERTPLAPPAREKVWIAPGNCLIANHVAPDDMLMTALSFGKVNQFVGYIKPTWFGFAGWTTWRLFASGAHSLAESHHIACRMLLEKLEKRDWADEREHEGLLWDRDATIFYGDPMQSVRLKMEN